MMAKKNEDFSDNWFSLLFGLIAIAAIKTIFENDSSKIVSKKGKKFLLDDDRMNKLNKKFENSDLDKNEHEFYI